MKRFMIHNGIGLVILFSMTLFFSSCKKFVEVGAAVTDLDAKKVFQTDGSANSAILGIYTTALNDGRGIQALYTICMGNSADELISSAANYTPFMNNAIPVTSGTVSDLWNLSYRVIGQCNFAIDGLRSSEGLTPAVKSNLMGETLFWRAFVYFYMINMFGDVPLVAGTNSFDKGNLSRASSAEVWAQIIKDLQEAEPLLSVNYPATATRSRVNRSVAQALLARVYLYQKNWTAAEASATSVINNTGTYHLEEQLSSVFKNGSSEIIWQLSNINGVSVFGPLYNYLPASVPAISMRKTYYDTFETDDNRKSEWMNEQILNGNTYCTINKYKLRSGTGDEYDVIMRLAEMYLIRAEARAELNKLSGANGAEGDINSIRLRAGLTKTTAISQAQLLLAIEQERKSELFGEMGHRWMDLK